LRGLPHVTSTPRPRTQPPWSVHLEHPRTHRVAPISVSPSATRRRLLALDTSRRRRTFVLPDDNPPPVAFQAENYRQTWTHEQTSRTEAGVARAVLVRRTACSVISRVATRRRRFTWNNACLAPERLRQTALLRRRAWVHQCQAQQLRARSPRAACTFAAPSLRRRPPAAPVPP